MTPLNNLELIEFWSQMDDLKVLFKKTITILQIFVFTTIIFFFICLKRCQMETDILIVHLWNNVFIENKIYRKNEILY